MPEDETEGKSQSKSREVTLRLTQVKTQETNAWKDMLRPLPNVLERRKGGSLEETILSGDLKFE